MFDTSCMIWMIRNDIFPSTLGSGVTAGFRPALWCKHLYLHSLHFGPCCLLQRASLNGGASSPMTSHCGLQKLQINLKAWTSHLIQFNVHWNVHNQNFYQTGWSRVHVTINNRFTQKCKQNYILDVRGRLGGVGGIWNTSFSGCKTWMSKYRCHKCESSLLASACT